MSGSASDYILQVGTYLPHLPIPMSSPRLHKFFVARFSWHYLVHVPTLPYLPNLLNFLKYLRHYILADQRAIDLVQGMFA